MPNHIPDGDYTLTDGAAWFTVKNLSIRIKETDEGVTVDIYPAEDEMSAAIASTYAFFTDNEP